MYLSSNLALTPKQILGLLRQCEKYNNKDTSQYINIREGNILHNRMGVREYPPEERGISDRI